MQEMNPKDKLKNLISSATSLIPEMAGSVVAEATSNYVGGLSGAALGGAVGTSVISFLQYIKQEFIERQLSSSEKKRVNTVIDLAKEKIDNKIKAGDKIRNDNFFINENERSSISEIFEGIVLAAQREHEEKKNVYYANLLANIAFDDNTNRCEANFLLKIAQRLTYRELCILSMSVVSDKSHLRQNNYHNYENFDSSLISLLNQLTSLYQKQLINFSGEALLGMTDINPSQIRIQGLGAQLYRLMELDQIPILDILPLVEILQK